MFGQEIGSEDRDNLMYAILLASAPPRPEGYPIKLPAYTPYPTQLPLSVRQAVEHMWSECDEKLSFAELDDLLLDGPEKELMRQHLEPYQQWLSGRDRYAEDLVLLTELLWKDEWASQMFSKLRCGQFPVAEKYEPKGNPDNLRSHC